ncbi:MAG: AAA family ATPase [Dehalococcoidia bacterium]
MASAAGASPFVGRRRELATLTKCLTAACQGEGSVILLTGEPGIGKTRTIQERAEAAGRQGALVLWGHSYEGGVAPPYRPWVEALGEAVASIGPDGWAAALGPRGTAIGALIPEVRVLLPDLPQPVPLQSGGGALPPL